jgi:hypothetical protein
MAYTVQAAFDGFYESINLSGDHRDTANTRRDRIVSLLENHFEIVEAFPSGSIPRFTAVRSYADVDVIVALHYGKHIKDRKPSAVLQSLRTALAKYETSVRQNGQAVTLRFETWPNVDIVPANQVTDGQGNVTSYSIPDSSKEQWLYSRPKTHSQNIEKRSSTAGASFRKIIKMVKWWDHKHSATLQSFHLEVIALSALTTSLNDMPWDVFSYFNNAASLAQSGMLYEGSYADAYLDYTARREATSRLEKARDIARDAWYATHGTNSDRRGAIDKWRVLFRDQFPTYG